MVTVGVVMFKGWRGGRTDCGEGISSGETKETDEDDDAGR